MLFCGVAVNGVFELKIQRVLTSLCCDVFQSTQSPLPPPKRQRSTGGKTNPPDVPTPPLYDDDITTRGLLRGIIQMGALNS